MEEDVGSVVDLKRRYDDNPYISFNNGTSFSDIRALISGEASRYANVGWLPVGGAR